MDSPTAGTRQRKGGTKEAKTAEHAEHAEYAKHGGPHEGSKETTKIKFRFSAGKVPLAAAALVLSVVCILLFGSDSVPLSSGTIKAKCDTLSCGEEHVLRAKAHKLLCAGEECHYNTDKARCCQPRAPCSSLRQVRPGFVLKPDAARIHCAGAKCDMQKDNDVCTEAAARCDTMKCNNEAILRYDASRLYCAGAACGHSSDEAKCCEPRARCSSLSGVVPKGYVLKTDADDIFCVGASCDLRADVAACCDHQATCDNLDCGKHSDLVEDAVHIYCLGTACNVGDDWGHCCMDKDHAKCSTLRAPQGYVLKPHADSLLCADRKCDPIDDAAACFDAQAGIRVGAIVAIVAVVMILVFFLAFEIQTAGHPKHKSHKERHTTVKTHAPKEEVIQHVAEPKIEERIPKVEVKEVIKHVAEPKIEERIVYVPKVEVKEVIKHVPKIEYREKIVYHDVPVAQPVQVVQQPVRLVQQPVQLVQQPVVQQPVVLGRRALGYVEFTTYAATTPRESAMAAASPGGLGYGEFTTYAATTPRESAMAAASPRKLTRSPSSGWISGGAIGA